MWFTAPNLSGSPRSQRDSKLIHPYTFTLQPQEA
jgi:hypothetical protein